MRGGFQYTPPRPIQYGRQNPYSGITQGLEAGMRVGLAKERQGPPDMFVQAPGKFDDMDKSEYFAQEKADMQMLTEWEKKARGDDKDQKALNYQSLIESGQIRSDIVKNALLKGVSPKEIQETFEAVQNNDPLAANLVGRLKQKMGTYKDKKTGEEKGPGMSIVKKEREILKGREEVLASYLDNMLDFHANPQKYSSRSGKLNDKMKDALQQQQDAIEELFRINPKRAKKYLTQLKGLRQTAKPGADQTGKRSSWVAMMQKAYKDNRYTNKKLAAEAREMKRILLSRPGRITQWEMNEFQKIMKNRGAVGSSKKLKIGRIYPDAAGNKAKYGGIDAQGEEIWIEVR